ncbi:type II toxin-antitoxin system VapC family toxin [Methylobacter psychrophilus]|uniref:type II toxin-antitoxin system VapC family toxin n=1 Tax=Methylobacter psychrophilus TaxID=96941 RepID=UPI0021D4CA90|nr:PIN domain-containing protein [Methylobacter psychrophilus]
MIIADTGFWVALFDPRDNHHQTVRAYALTINEPLITTLPVVTEVCYLLQKRCNPLKAAIFLKTQQTAHLFSLFAIKEAHLPRIVELMIQYADLPMDLADASLVLLAEELGHGRIISTDRRDFHTYRWKNHQPFCNLLEVALCQ